MAQGFRRRVGRRPGPDRAGFTLIEMLVVIGIMSVLMAGLVVAVVGVMEKTHYKKTVTTIEMLKTALSDYKNTFGGYPPVFGGPGGGAPDSQVYQVAAENQVAGRATLTLSSSSTLSEVDRNQALRVYLEHGFEGVRGTPIIPSTAQLNRADTDGDGIREYVDGWGLALVFNRPGKDHFDDIDGDGRVIEGRYSTEAEPGVNPSKWVFEIYSLGSNNIDDYSGHPDHGDDVISWGTQDINR
jgi:prepilin-type N-terminal cleavage/methylation domain-containing protein